jgi:hypothetical protein
MRILLGKIKNRLQSRSAMTDHHGQIDLVLPKESSFHPVNWVLHTLNFTMQSLMGLRII